MTKKFPPHLERFRELLLAALETPTDKNIQSKLIECLTTVYLTGKDYEDPDPC